jgi:ferredoxin-type protein NapH
VRGPVRTGLVLTLLGALLFVALVTDLPWLESLNTYGNFDAPSDQSFVHYLTPGTPDSAAVKVYRFGEGIHATPIVALLSIFAIFLFLRAWRSEDVKLGISRWLTAWGAFVVARFGLLRVSGAAPVRRCTYGIFPFLNCQACEMASGGCPIGALQASLVDLRFPLLPLAVLLITGLALGRWICGWLCPFGLISDIFDRISKKTWRPARAWSWLKFGVLALIFVVPLMMGAAGGSTWLPFCSTLCISGSVFGLLPYYATTGAGEFAAVFTPGHLDGLLIVLFHASVLFAFVWLARKISGRVFCKYVCPMGAFLGLFHRLTMVRVIHDPDPCNDCGKCRGDCPMQIDLSDPHFLVQSNCVRCGRCVKICPTDARRWVFGFGKGKEAELGRPVGLSHDA